jgi:hypothetical protein
VLRVRAQRFNFRLHKLAPSTGRQITERQRSFTDTDQPSHIKAKQTRDFANLAFLAFAHDDPQPRSFGGALEHLDPRGSGRLSIFPFDS